MNAEKDKVRHILTNRRARHEYLVLETLEVGIALRGTEVKSARAGKINLQDAYASIENGELFMHNMHISPFEKGNIFNHDPMRIRKLLARKKEIRKLEQKVNEKGLTLIPLQLYFLGRHLKIELGVCRGKKTYDKRHALKERDTRREMERQL
ncbi:MAG: SsrA-binding protein SmpB [Bacteroidota bacterium]|jgi:SsrA-binding protein|nr:SsrA-binding protein SmpB [Bacteroidota bacterium]